MLMDHKRGVKKILSNKGFAISGILYSIFILFLVLMVGVLQTLQNRKNSLDTLKKGTLGSLEYCELKVNKSKGVDTVSVKGCLTINNKYACDCGAIVELNATAVPGYQPGTWTGENLINGRFKIMKDTELSISAIANNYTITLNNNSGTGGSSSATVTYDSSTLSSVTNPTRTNYIFEGWTKTKDGTDYVIKNGTLQASTAYTDANSKWTYDGDVTLYAKWSIAPSIVTLNPNSGTGGTSSITINNGSSSLATITAPTYADHELLGWTKTQNGTDYIIKNGVLQANTAYTDANGKWTKIGNVTLYAKWEHAVYLIKNSTVQSTYCGSVVAAAGGGGGTGVKPEISGTTYTEKFGSSAYTRSGKVYCNQAFNYTNIDKIEMVSVMSASNITSGYSSERIGTINMGIATSVSSFTAGVNSQIYYQSTTRGNWPSGSNGASKTYTLSLGNNTFTSGYFFLIFYVNSGTGTDSYVRAAVKSVKIIYKD